MRSRFSVPALVAASAAFLLPVAYGERFAAYFWAPKAAVLLIAGAVGITLLPDLLRSEARSRAIAALLFLVGASLATVFSREPVLALVGRYNQGTGLVFLFACVGMWGLGSRLRPDDRPLIVWALVAGVGVSSAVAVLQTFDLASTDALDAEGRASGLSGNAVHLAALLASVTGLAAYRARLAGGWILVAGLCAGVAQLTGTRFALVVIVVASVAGAVRLGWRRGPVLLVVVAVGIVLGSAVAESRDLASASARSATDTGAGAGLAQSGGVRVRLDVWSVGIDAFGRRPLIGYGPGRFRAATVEHQTLRVAQLEGGDVTYTDAHNIVVEHLVTTGLLGTAALAWWVVLLLRHARGDLAWAAVALGAMALVQLMNVATTPLIFFLLGAAAPAVAARPPRSHRASAAIVLSAAVACASALVVGDVSIRRGYRDGDVQSARTADRLLRAWPEPATLHAALAESTAVSKEGSFGDAIRWRHEAIRRDRFNPEHYWRLAQTELLAGRTADAHRHFLRALDLNPWSTMSLLGLAVIAEGRGDTAEARAYAQRGLEVRPNAELLELLDRLGA